MNVLDRLTSKTQAYIGGAGLGTRDGELRAKLIRLIRAFYSILKSFRTFFGAFWSNLRAFWSVLEFIGSFWRIFDYF